jgi:hypothetical protein
MIIAFLWGMDDGEIEEGFRWVLLEEGHSISSGVLPDFEHVAAGRFRS